MIFEPDFSPAAALEMLRNSSSPGQCARELLGKGQARLEAAFATTPIRALVRGRAAMVDRVVTAAWSLFELDHLGALIAVGGYGRGELHPHSDVDLLVLLNETPDSTQQEQLAHFVTFLWDTGLEIGHSVRTFEECVALATDDITVATNIMESRTLAGDDSLRARLAAHTGPDHIWPTAAFFAAKWEEQNERHRKHNYTEYNLEPDLKNAPGGLRDLQMVSWVAKRHFCPLDRAGNLERLVSQGFLTQREYAALRRCEDFLFQVRWALHTLSGRNENRLLFDYQRQVAALLGHEDSDANMAVELFMKEFYRVALTLSVMNELLLQLFDEAILQADQPRTIRPLNRRFQIHNDYLEVTQPDIFTQHPSALLEMFVVLAHNPEVKGVRATTMRDCMDKRRLINQAYRDDPRNAALFMQLIRSPHKLWAQLRRMKRYGILGRYLPEFGRIIGMMQYDLFHIYTVDAHTLLVVKNMRRMRYEETRERFPLACDVFYRLPKPELLYVAGLYHDIAKGRGGDHSELGADDAIAFCQRHGLSSWDGKLVAWLVRSHLLMSVTAQRKDIADPEVVLEFARQVGDLVHLDYLYVLTVADINATNPKLWNSWRDALLRQLYTETKRALRRGLNNPIDKQDWIDDTRRDAMKLLRQRPLPMRRIEQFWSGIGDEYFLRENARDIAWHTEAILNRDTPNEPLVLVRESSGGQYEGGTQIFVYTPDTENLFAATVNAMDHLNLTIMDARIITSADGFSLDTYIVLDEHGTPIGNDRPRLQTMRETLTQALRDPSQFGRIVQRQMPRRNKHFKVPTEVIISNDIVNDRTVVEVQALDRPGLLARIGRLFMEFDLLLQNARIATLGEKVEDVFFVTQKDGSPVSDPELCKRLQQRLQEELDDTSRDALAPTASG